MKHILTLSITATILGNASAQRVMPLGDGMAGSFGVYDMTEYQGTLVVAGAYSSFLGHARNNIQAWDGTDHFDLPGAFTSIPQRVRALEVFNGDLIAAGNEPTFGHVVRWDGSSWQAMGAGLTAQARALCVHDDELYVAGTDSIVSRWTGSAWEPIGNGFNGIVAALESHNGQLYVGGSFDHDASNTVELRRLARWNGSSWEEVGTGFSGSVNDLLSTEEGLVIGGIFATSGAGDQEFPSWTVYDGSLFTAPSDDGLGLIEGISAHPDGGFIVGGSIASTWVNGSASRLPFTNVRATIRYGTDVLLGGQSGNSYKPVSVVGRLVDGVDLAHLDINGIRATLTPSWTMFRDGQRAGFEAPKDGGVHSIFSVQPWSIGDVNEALHRAAPGYGPDSLLGCGPNATEMNAAFYDRYYQVWKLDQSTILEHALHWNDPGYEMPYAIASWPGNGDVNNGEPARLAPFADLDSDGFYEPSSGEYPLIRGDQAVYHVLHSMPDPAGTDPIMSLDLAVMHYAYGDADQDDLYNTVFTNYRIINRGTDTYANFRFGAFTDYDLGFHDDDRVGCDSVLNMTYAYNGDELDDQVNPVFPGYGSDIPAQGTLFLNQALTAHRALGNGAPVYIADIMNGTQLGAPFTDPGYPTHFQYPGPVWSDNEIGDKRSVGSIGPFTLDPGDTLCVDLAYPFARATTGLPLESLTALLFRADALRAWYAAQGVDCQEVPDAITAIRTEPDQGSIVLYPNPTNASMTLTLSARPSDRSLVICSATGNVLRSSTLRAQTDRSIIDTSTLSPGLYILRVLGGNHDLAVRFVKM